MRELSANRGHGPAVGPDQELEEIKARLDALDDGTVAVLLKLHSTSE